MGYKIKKRIPGRKAFIKSVRSYVRQVDPGAMSIVDARIRGDRVWVQWRDSEGRIKEGGWIYHEGDPPDGQQPNLVKIQGDILPV